MIRCEAAHAEDPRDCEGPADAVRIVDQLEGERLACVLHGAVLLASLHAGRVYLGPRAFTGNGDVAPNAPIEVYGRAQQIKPFDFLRGQTAPPPRAGRPFGPDRFEAFTADQQQAWLDLFHAFAELLLPMVVWQDVWDDVCGLSQGYRGAVSDLATRAGYRATWTQTTDAWRLHVRAARTPPVRRIAQL